MPYLLDTNIVTYIRYGNEKIIGKLEAVIDEAFVSSIVAEETVRGCLATLNNIRGGVRGDVARSSTDLVRAIQDLSQFSLIPYTATAEVIFKTQKLKGMDGRIAAHALELGFILVTQNTRDFEKIPGLQLVNWIG